MDPTKSVGAEAAVAAVPSTPVVTPTQPVETTEPKEDSNSITLSPRALNERLERARQQVLRDTLRDLGVDKPEDAKAALAELKRRQDAEKTEQEKLRAQVSELETKAKRVTDLETVVGLKAKAELEALTDAQRKAVIDIAADDPSAQLRAIDALRPTWTASSAAQPAAAVAPPLPAAATTATANAAPSPAETSQGENVLATYRALQQTNPVKAAEYMLANLPAYLKAIQDARA